MFNRFRSLAGEKIPSFHSPLEITRDSKIEIEIAADFCRFFLPIFADFCRFLPIFADFRELPRIWERESRAKVKDRFEGIENRFLPPPFPSCHGKFPGNSFMRICNRVQREQKPSSPFSPSLFFLLDFYAIISRIAVAGILSPSPLPFCSVERDGTSREEIRE